MAIDSFAERMACAGVPMMVVGTNVYPGTFATGAGRAAAAWSFVNGVLPPPAGGGGLLGTIECGNLVTALTGGSPLCAGCGNWLA